MHLARRSHPDPKVDWLASLPWWSHLPLHDLRVLASTGDRATVPAGTMIMAEGERSLESVVVVAGQMEVVRGGQVVARVGPGAVVGELSLLDRARRTADVRTTTEVELLVFSVGALRRAFSASERVRTQVRVAAETHGS